MSSAPERVEPSAELPAHPGLSSEEAHRRLAEHGPNLLATDHRRRLAVEFLARFRNPLVLLLLAASAVSALTGDVASFAIVTIIVCMSVTLDFVQEHRAGRAAERLKASVAVRATVVRDGRSEEVPVADVVPGDVVRLAAGDLVPADGRVLEARDFFVNQALLTGEPYPVERRPCGAGDDTATVCMGTSVVSGTATVEVERTGRRTALGGIAESVVRSHRPRRSSRGRRRSDTSSTPSCIGPGSSRSCSPSLSPSA